MYDFREALLSDCRKLIVAANAEVRHQVNENMAEFDRTIETLKVDLQQLLARSVNTAVAAPFKSSDLAHRDMLSETLAQEISGNMSMTEDFEQADGKHYAVKDDLESRVEDNTHSIAR